MNKFFPGMAAGTVMMLILAAQPLAALAGEAPSRGGDEEIARCVGEVLAAHGYSPEVTVNEGRVKLRGILPTQEDLPVAEFQARQVPGVRGVNVFHLGYDYYMGGEGGE